MNKSLLIQNCFLYNNNKAAADILIENGLIKHVGALENKNRMAIPVLDAGGRIVAPGFIDLHLHGAGGADVLDGTIDSLKTISKTCARYGVTSFLATTMFRNSGKNSHLSLISRHIENDLGGARCLGIHLEGPFINMAKKGMIAPDFICSPSPTILTKIMDISGTALKMMTVAPELKGSGTIIRRLHKKGIIISLGHTDANYDQTLNGFDAGITHATHLFNAMASLHHRAPGPLLAIFENPNVTAELISDGVHVDRHLIKFTSDILGMDRLILITDGTAALGLKDGKYQYDTFEVDVRKGTVYYKDGSLVGTAMGMNGMIRRFIEFTSCSLSAAIRTITENPARLLNIFDQKGAISPGKDGDLVILDRDLNVWATIVNGRIVYQM